MTEIPTWWLVASLVFFIVNILFFSAFTVVLIRVASVIKDLQPRVAELSTQVSSLVQTVEGVAKKVEELTVSTKNTVENVGGKTRGVVNSVEIIATSTARQFEKLSPLVVGTLTAIRIIRAVGAMRKEDTARKEKQLVKKKKGLLSLKA